MVTSLFFVHTWDMSQLLLRVSKQSQDLFSKDFTTIFNQELGYACHLKYKNDIYDVEDGNTALPVSVG